MVDVIEIQEIEHSPLGASGSGRWMNCPGSINLTKLLGGKADGGSSEPAAEGTVAHEVLSNCLENGAEPWEYSGDSMSSGGFTFEVNDDMVSAVTLAHAHIQRMVREADESVIIGVEKSMRHPDHEMMFGTTDFSMMDTVNQVLDVVDYKHGIYVNVEPDSTQNKYYGVLNIVNTDPSLLPEDLKDLRVRLTIIQPRQSHPNGPIRVHETNGAEIMDWFRDELVPAMSATKDKDALLAIGEWCRFCPNKEHCPALKSDVTELKTDVGASHLTDGELSELLRKEPAIRKYFDTLRQVQFARAMNGVVFEHQKLVDKKANRIFKEGAEEAAKKKFGKDAYSEPKLKSPPQMAKLKGGSAFVSQFAFTPSVGKTMAPRSDKRSEVKGRNADAFESVQDL